MVLKAAVDNGLIIVMMVHMFQVLMFWGTISINFVLLT